MKTLISLLVGSHFRPPAKQVLEHLPAGAELTLEPEPSNPYDENAIKVLVDPRLIPESEHPVLAEKLPLTGNDLQDLLAGGLVFLGYVAKSNGKPLQGTGFEGNEEFHQRALESGWDQGTSVLGFTPEGKPTIKWLGT